MSKELTIYLAGAMSGLTIEEMNMWRNKVNQNLRRVAAMADVKVNVINPVMYFNFDNNRHQTEMEVMKFDLSKVTSSDIVIVNMDKLNTSIGTCIECYEAWKKGIPVLAFGSDYLWDNLHPWIQNCITRHDVNYIDTVNYINDLYMH